MTLPSVFDNKYDKNFQKNYLNIEGERETYKCDICGKNYNRKANLTFHINSHNFNNNNSDGNSERFSQNTCNICFKTFTIKKNLLKHLRAVHKNFSEAARMVVKKIKCPEKNCKFTCRMMRELREHIEKTHKVKILKDTLEFPNEAEFQKWKKQEESNTIAWFVTGRKKNILSDGTKKQTLYCHRTGHYNPKGFGKYRTRSLGSCKIGVTCPAAMEVRESSDGGLAVTYYKTHLGHVLDVAYLKLSTEEKAQLAEKIKQGFSFDAILDDVKESQDVNKKKNKRIHLLSKRDLYSIMRTTNNYDKKSTKNEHAEEIIRENAYAKENEISGGNFSHVDNMQTGKVEHNQSFNKYQRRSSVISYAKAGCQFEENPSCLSQVNQKVPSVPQTPQDEVAPQFLILSPDFNSASEFFFISTSEATLAQSVILPQTKIPVTENCSVQSTGSQTEITDNVIAEEKFKFNNSNLQLKLKEKLQKISEMLPLSEHLTPKQYNLINAKLNGVLDSFNAAKVKADARKQNFKKAIKKKIKY